MIPKQFAQRRHLHHLPRMGFNRPVVPAPNLRHGCEGVEHADSLGVPRYCLSASDPDRESLDSKAGGKLFGAGKVRSYEPLIPVLVAADPEAVDFVLPSFRFGERGGDHESVSSPGAGRCAEECVVEGGGLRELRSARRTVCANGGAHLGEPAHHVGNSREALQGTDVDLIVHHDL